jgi:hypothetical protein
MLIKLSSCGNGLVGAESRLPPETQPLCNVWIAGMHFECRRALEAYENEKLGVRSIFCSRFELCEKGRLYSGEEARRPLRTRLRKNGDERRWT